MTVLEDIRRIEREERDRALDFNARMLELARHNGYELELVEHGPGGRLWFVPAPLRAAVGYMAAVLR